MTSMAKFLTMRFHRLGRLYCLVCGVLWSGILNSAEKDQLVTEWLSAAKSLQTWEAQVLQTRYLKAFTQPLVSTGKVWFATPNQFRWQLGEPVQSLALRTGPALWVLSPKLRRAEHYQLDSLGNGPAKDLMGLLDMGFPKDEVSFRKQFRIIEASTNSNSWSFRMEPESSSVKSMLPELKVEIAAGTKQLIATELILKDGSRLRNEFKELSRNSKISTGLFTTNLDATWKITTSGPPLKK